ncbi:MAG: FGGY family carbohydrate kinase [Marmoricola sp.]
MATRASLGIDLGTSGVKAVLLDEAGTVHRTTSRTYPVTSAHPGWAETDPLQWERAAQDAVAELLDGSRDVEVVAVGIDAQMHGTVLLDDRGVAVRPAVLWPDARATDQMPRWEGLPQELRGRLANPLTPGMPGPVLGWLAEHEPDVVAAATSFVFPKDWLRSRLVPSTACTDASDASASLLWDVQTDSWSTEVADLTGVPVRLLPPVRSAEESAGGLDPAAAARWGLPAYVPVSIGCSDVAGTLLGLVAQPNRMVLTVGTGAQLVLPGVSPRPTDRIRHHLYRDAHDGWYAMGAIMNAGLALGRVVELLGADWDDLYRARDSDAALPGFVPYFAGERLPEVIEAGVAGWFDVGLGTTRADLLAAALEGVAFTIRRSFEAMPACDEVVDLVGGGTRSPVFNQLLADVLHRPLRKLEQRDATVLGAARLGWRAAGEQSGEETSTRNVLVEPHEAEHLDERYARFLRRTATVEEEPG